MGNVFLEVMVPLQRVTSGLGRGVAGLWNQYVGLIGVARQNRRLRARVRELQRASIHQQELERMNRRLKRLLALQRRLPTAAIAAQVTARDASVWFQSLTLDKGESDGVHPGMPVMAPEGAVGVIASASAHASRVLLLTDPNSGIDVLVQRSRVRGIVSGILDEGTVLKYVKRSEDVRVGDFVVASGMDGVFPKGLPVGRVTRVSRKDRGLFLYAEVAPVANADRLEEVVVALASGAEIASARTAVVPDIVGPPDPASLGILGPDAPDSALRAGGHGH